MIKNNVTITPLTITGRKSITVVSNKVKAGFPSPADDYAESPLDLNDRLIRNPEATFLVRVSGASMVNAGISDGDWLLVDKSLEAVDGSIVIAIVNGEFTLKRFHRKDGAVKLLAENPDYPAIEFSEGDEMYIWGVVKHAIKDF